jgi:O-antigen/teichoic acid export membrane protein
MVVSWASRGISVFAALLLIPVLYRYMSHEVLGVWYLIGTGQAFVGLFGFGLAPVLTRHIALLVKGSHIEEGTEVTAEERIELEDLLFTGRRALQWMAVATMLGSWMIGYFLIIRIHYDSLSHTTIFWAWTIMCVGWSIGVWMSFLDCWVTGIGYVGTDTVVVMAVTLASTLASVAAVVVWHAGLVTLASIALIAVIVQRTILVLFLHRNGLWKRNLSGRWSPEIARRLVRPSFQYWLMTVGTFLIYKTDQYFIALYLGTTRVALYQSTYSTIMALALAAGSATQSIAVFASQLWAENRIQALDRLFFRGCRIGFVILISGEVFLLTTGKSFFLIWLKGSFIGYPVLLLLMLTLALDTQHGLLTNVSRATDDEVYAIPAVAAGIINLVLTWILVRRIGLIGIVLGTLIAQLSTNNWYGVYRPLKRLNITFGRYSREVLFPVFGFGIVSMGIVLICRQLAYVLFGHSLTIGFVSGLILASATGGMGLLMAIRGWNQASSTN